MVAVSLDVDVIVGEAVWVGEIVGVAVGSGALRLGVAWGFEVLKNGTKSTVPKLKSSSKS